MSKDKLSQPEINEIIARDIAGKLFETGRQHALALRLIYGALMKKDSALNDNWAKVGEEFPRDRQRVWSFNPCNEDGDKVRQGTHFKGSAFDVLIGCTHWMSCSMPEPPKGE